MSDFRTALSMLRRPRLLMRAVRHGLRDYQRGRLLKRLVPGETRPEQVVASLFAAEARLEEIRRAGDATYSPARHIEVLVALVMETRFLAAAQAQPQAA